MRSLLQHRSKLMVVALILLASLTLLTAVPAFGQEVPGGEALEPLVMIMYGIMIVAYIYTALALQVIARKTHTTNGWWAWIPILQIILSLNIAKKPTWWVVLCLIPIVNFVFLIMVWMAIAEARNKPSWWGILLIVPLVQFIVPGYLAWSD